MSGCTREQAILRSVRAGGDGDVEVREHLAVCPSCREAATLARRLGALALGDRERLGAPQVNATQVWWKAYLRRRRAQSEEATGPLRIAEVAVPLALTLVAGVAALLAMPAHWREALTSLVREAPAALASVPGWALALTAAATLALLATTAWALVARLRPRVEPSRKG